MYTFFLIKSISIDVMFKYNHIPTIDIVTNRKF